jgi:hypothetical protein
VAVALSSTPARAQANNASTAITQSTFVSPAQDLGFGITIPDDSDTDIYFTIAAPAGISWAAIGLGSSGMRGALVLMVYLSQSENGVTFSPRLATGHNEPVAYPDLKVQSLNGTGVFDDIYFFSARCSNCRSWPGGSIDVKSTSQPCIFATGPDGYLGSDDTLAPLRFHQRYGSFALDLVHATGPAAVPVISAATNTSVGAPLLSSQDGKRDWTASFHAVIMIGTFVGLLPMGVLLLRVGGWVRWHAANQGLALVTLTVGLGLGIYISTLYNRVRCPGLPRMRHHVLIPD